MASEKEVKLKLLDALYEDFRENAERYLDLVDNDKNYWMAYGNRNYGKTALKRKAVYLRQEIKNFVDLLIE